LKIGALTCALLTGLNWDFIVYGAVQSVGAPAQSDGRSTYHIFPQLVYGRLADGSFYQSMLLIDNPPGGSTANCTIGTSVKSAFSPSTIGSSTSFTLGPAQWKLNPYTDPSPLSLVSGNARVSCDSPVFATLLYSYNSFAGKTIAEATVLSAPVSTGFHLIADHETASN
jgi:hypothetical protein